MATSTLGSGTVVLAGTTSGTTTITATAVAGTTTLTLPAATDTLVGKATTDTLTNKTLTSATLTGVVTFDAGTAAAPAITTTGDTNTGIFFPAADTIGFAEGGAEAMRIDSSGNVSVGATSSSSQAFRVSQTAFPAVPSGFYCSAGDGAGAYQYGITRVDATNGRGFQFLSSLGAGNLPFYSISVGTAASTIAGMTFSEAMRIDSSANVGIGTTSPAAKLDVTNGASPASRLRVGVGAGAANTLYSTLAAGDYVNFETNGAERARIDSSGNFIYTQPSLACYVWTAFNPTNTSGTSTNAPATGTGYDTGFVTMVNSSGTLTITFDIAGKYLVSTNLQTAHANTYTNERSTFTLGGTATTATGTQNPTFSGIDSVDANTTGTYPIYVSATAAQTTTILPTYELTGSGTTAQHTCRPSVTIQYCGG